MLTNIGKWKIFALETGRFRLDGGAMMGSVPRTLWEKTNPPDKLNRIELAMRCLLADDGEHVVLVETGMGTKIDDKFRRMFAVDQSGFPLEDELKRVGYSREDVTHVILTHLHFDHAGGLTVRDNKRKLVPVFPNAEVVISHRNWDAGMKPNLRDRASYLTENYEPLLASGHLLLVPDNTDIIRGVSTMCVDGHTEGQQLVKIQDGEDAVVFCADLIPVRSHLKLPWIMGYDLHAARTLQEKTVFLQDAVRENWWLWFYHDPGTIAVRINQGPKYVEVQEEILIHG